MAVGESKTCGLCGQLKPSEEFHRNGHSKDGLQHWCKSCTKLQHKPASPEQKARNALAARRKRQRNRTYLREKNLLNNYGISGAEYDELLHAQGDKCAICGVTSCPSGHHLSVDHDHETGVVRGLLCKECNLGLGKFHDSIVRLKQAVRYLQCKS